jgi:predicted amidohydrolase
MKVSLVQNSPKLASDNFDATAKIIELCRDSDIVVFSELSLHGYLLMDSVSSEALVIKELFFFKELSVKFDIDIILGAIIDENNKFYNSAIYIEKNKITHIHHKNHLPNYGMFEEKRFFDSGDKVEIFDTKFGKSALLICEDLWIKSTVEIISKYKIENIFIIANSPARGFRDDGALEIEIQWKEILEDLSSRCNSNIFFTNRVGFEDGIGFWGGSRILKNGKAIQKAPLFKDYILEVDI